MHNLREKRREGDIIKFKYKSGENSGKLYRGVERCAMELEGRRVKFPREVGGGTEVENVYGFAELTLDPFASWKW